jgi:prolyl-tRNA synthetase
MMGDGRALQAGTSHNLGQAFARAYGIEFLDQGMQRAVPWSTSWGVTTRLIGGLIMTHGDDSGLILPPRVAPIQVVVVPIPPRKGDWSEVILPKAREVTASLRAAGLRAHLDDRGTQQPGFKYSDWEMRGVPVRLEIGAKDVEKQQVVLVRRDDRAKAFVPAAGAAAAAHDLLQSLQQDLLARARRFLEESTTHVTSYEEFKDVMATRRGFLVAGWCRDAACEAAIKEETKATVRVIPGGGEEGVGTCVRCGRPSPRKAYFAQAY